MRINFKASPKSAADFVFKHAFHIVLIGLIAFFSLATENFFSASNVFALLHATAPLLVVAAGLAIVIFTGKIDISIGAIALLSATVGMRLYYTLDFSPPAVLLVMIACGMLLGGFNALIIVVLRVNSLVATLATMIAFRGLALTLTESKSITLPEEIRTLGNAKLGPLFFDILIALAVVALLHLLVTRTQFGRWAMAIGDDEVTARTVGINVGKTTFLTFIISGGLAALAGALTMVQIGQVNGFLGLGLEFTAVAVVVVGGISLYGGIGAVFPGVLIGALTLGVVRNGLDQLGADPYFYAMITGGVIFVAIYAATLRRFASKKFSPRIEATGVDVADSSGPPGGALLGSTRGSR